MKASGLCAGKGVIICESVEDGHKAVDEMMSDKIFGASGDEVSLFSLLFCAHSLLSVNCDLFSSPDMPVLRLRALRA